MAADNLKQFDTNDPVAKIKAPSFAPNFGNELVSHVLTFQGVATSLGKIYRPSDEALKHRPENAACMRNDPTVMECVESRQRACALLNWHIEPEDSNSNEQKRIADQIKLLCESIPRFMQYREQLLHATWLGKAGVAQTWGKKIVRRRMATVPVKTMPINGDKIVFRWDDARRQYNETEIGIRVGHNWQAGPSLGVNAHNALRAPDNRGMNGVAPTEFGLAYFLKKSERPLLALHKHYIEDAEYEDPHSAGRIHGVGIRSRIYWAWYQKQETLALLMEYLERSAAGFEIWYYQAGNPESEAKTRQAAQERIGSRNIILVPYVDGESARPPYERIEPGMAGAEALKSIVTEYFGHVIKRYILGQTLTSEQGSTGLGSNLASIHLETFLQIVKYDAILLEETITEELIRWLVRYNFPEWSKYEFKFRIDTESEDAESKLEACQKAYSMGLSIKAQDVYDLLGLAKPGPTDEALRQPAPMPMGAGPGSDPNGAAGAGGAPPGMTEALSAELTRRGMMGGGEGGESDPNGGSGGEGGPGKPSAPPSGGVQQFAGQDGPQDSERVKIRDYGAEPERYERSDIARAVAETETPTEAQMKSGNYRKGTVRIHGLTIKIETPKGKKRRPEWRPLDAHYGYIARTEGADGDAVDCFIGPRPESEVVFVVDMPKAGGVRFDEHKVMIGWTNAESAAESIRKSYSDDCEIGTITAMTVPQFKAWLKSGDTTKRISGQVSNYEREDSPEHYERWITIGAQENSKGKRKGGFPVKIDDDGRIIAGGPKALQGKHVSQVAEHFEAERRKAADEHEANSPIGKSRSYGKIVAHQAEKWGMSEEDYDHFANEVWSEQETQARAREAAKAYARKRLNLNAADIARLENQGFDYGSRHSKVKGLDTLGREMASMYPELGWGEGYDDGSQNYDEQLWSLIREGKQAIPSRISREYHDAIDAHLEQQLKAAASSYRPAAYDVPEEFARQGDVLLYARVFDESKISRASDGKFAKKGGGSARGEGKRKTGRVKRPQRSKPAAAPKKAKPKLTRKATGKVKVAAGEAMRLAYAFMRSKHVDYKEFRHALSDAWKHLRGEETVLYRDEDFSNDKPRPANREHDDGFDLPAFLSHVQSDSLHYAADDDSEMTDTEARLLRVAAMLKEAEGDDDREQRLAAKFVRLLAKLADEQGQGDAEEPEQYAKPTAGQKSFDWDDDKHPRADDGKFAPKGEGEVHSAGEAAKKKEPHEMTLEEFVQHGNFTGPKRYFEAGEKHRQAIEKAFDERKKIPAEAVEGYPELRDAVKQRAERHESNKKAAEQYRQTLAGQLEAYEDWHDSDAMKAVHRDLMNSNPEYKALEKKALEASISSEHEGDDLDPAVEPYIRRQQLIAEQEAKKRGIERPENIAQAALHVRKNAAPAEEPPISEGRARAQQAQKPAAAADADRPEKPNRSWKNNGDGTYTAPNGTVWRKAKEGGEVSPVTGGEFKGGALMPIHGLHKKQEKTETDGTADLGGGSTGKVKDGKRNQGRTINPMTPEEIAEERRRRDEAERWQNIKNGPLSEFMNIPDKPWGKPASTVSNKWRNLAKELGPEKTKELHDNVIAPMFAEHFEEELSKDAPESMSEEDARKNLSEYYDGLKNDHGNLLYPKNLRESNPHALDAEFAMRTVKLTPERLEEIASAVGKLKRGESIRVDSKSSDESEPEASASSADPQPAPFDLNAAMAEAFAAYGRK